MDRYLLQVVDGDRSLTSTPRATKQSRYRASILRETLGYDRLNGLMKWYRLSPKGPWRNEVVDELELVGERL